MRNLEDIIIDLKDGKTVDYEEARIGLLVVNDLLFFAEGDVRNLLNGGTISQNFVKGEYDNQAGRFSKRHIAALKKSPEEFLGNHHPDNPQQKRFREIGDKILDKVIREAENKS